ncbi:CoA transferase [Candidatus Bathyarchaeota archaeon]|nr:CoA transferase [Candidatus Bathyarchaeota archaeon]
METLRGIKVLDFTHLLAGPYCTMVLGDMGAEVVKVEPLKGDQLRGLGTVFLEEESACFLSVNRNKKSIALDLASEQGREIALKMLESSDILVENFRPGTMDKLGLNYTEACQRNPQIIYCSISAYGQEGPLRDKPAADTIIQGVSGIMSITGEPEAPPLRVGAPISDMFGACYALQGILSALYVRSQTGKGQKVEVALLDSLIAAQTPIAGMYFAQNQEPARLGNVSPAAAPAQTFKTRDDFINVSVGESSWPGFCRALDLKHLVEDQRFSSNTRRMENRDLLIPILETIFLTKTTHAWIEFLEEANVICGPINDYDELFKESQVFNNQMVVEMRHPKAGSLRMTGNPVKLSQTPWSLRLPPPLLGEHSSTVLQELGYSPKEIKSLLTRKVIK